MSLVDLAALVAPWGIPAIIADILSLQGATTWLVGVLTVVEFGLILYTVYPKTRTSPGSRAKASIFYLTINVFTNIIGFFYFFGKIGV